MKPRHREHYIRDIAILALSVAVAYLLKTSGAFYWMLLHAERIGFLGPLVSGAFFTSFFTVVPATGAIIELARGGVPVARLALIGAIGAMLTDYLIFLLLREGIAEPLLALVQAGSGDRLKYFVRRGKHRLVGTLLGAIIIASPLPDETGLLLMGLSRTKWYVTLPLTYALNVAGIAALALAGRSLF